MQLILRFFIPIKLSSKYDFLLTEDRNLIENVGYETEHDFQKK